MLACEIKSYTTGATASAGVCDKQAFALLTVLLLLLPLASAYFLQQEIRPA